jgi:hypothetical protein
MLRASGSKHRLRLMMRFVVITTAIFTACAAVAEEWRRFTDPEFGYSIDLPDDGFDVEVDATKNGLTLYEIGGRGQIDVYAFENEQQLSLAQVRDALAQADRIEDITYSRSGASWFVISGHYRRLADEATDLIFYAKFRFSADRRVLSAFEASYPITDKERFDPIIERIEDSLTRPSS